MDFHEKRLACPECSKEVAVEYLAPRRDGAPTDIETRCPHCDQTIRTQIPTKALVYSAKTPGAPRNPAMRAVAETT